jgi:hypothetical protein
MLMSHDPSPNCTTDEIMQVMFMIDSTTCTTLIYGKKRKRKRKSGVSYSTFVVVVDFIYIHLTHTTK